MEATDFPTLLKQLRDPDLYVRVPGRVVFDAHQEADRNGQVKKFDRRELEHMARVNNANTRQGLLTPLVYGHTDPHERDESRQPPHRGYALNYRVIDSAQYGRPVLVADYYFPCSEFADARTYPFTSIELWPDSGILPISLLRRAPQRPLQWIYSRGAARPPSALARYGRAGVAVRRYAIGSFWTDNGGTNMAGKKTSAGKGPASRGTRPRQYEMDGEEDMPLDDETPGQYGEDDMDGAAAMPDDAAAPAAEPSIEEKAMHYAKHCMSHPYARDLNEHFAAQDGTGDGGTAPPHDPTEFPDALEEMPEQHSAFTAPSATNGGGAGRRAPGTDRYRKGGDPTLYRRIEELEQREADKAAENWALQLENEGYELDQDPEDGDLVNLARAYRKGGDDACARCAGKVRKYRRQRVDHRVGQIHADTARRGGSGGSAAPVDLELDPETMPREDAERVLAYQRQHSLWDTPLADLAARALPQRYGRREQGKSNGRNGATSRNGS